MYKYQGACEKIFSSINSNLPTVFPLLSMMAICDVVRFIPSYSIFCCPNNCDTKLACWRSESSVLLVTISCSTIVLPNLKQINFKFLKISINSYAVYLLYCSSISCCILNYVIFISSILKIHIIIAIAKLIQ